MPPKTTVPMACWLAAPAPEAPSNGTTPRIKANDVITIGRKRRRVASTAASAARRRRRGSPALHRRGGKVEARPGAAGRRAHRRPRPGRAHASDRRQRGARALGGAQRSQEQEEEQRRVRRLS